MCCFVFYALLDLVKHFVILYLERCYINKALLTCCLTVNEVDFDTCTDTSDLKGTCTVFAHQNTFLLAPL